MVSLPSIDLNLRTLDLGSTDIDARAGASSLDVLVASPVIGVTLHVGLDRLLYSTSPIDRLLHGNDPLARFRTGAVPSDPAPAMTKGMNVRIGDIHAEIATRHDIGGTRVPDATLRADAMLRAADDGVTARATVGAVRDPAETAALPQRIDGAAATTASDRGIGVNAALTLTGASIPVAPREVSFLGLVNVLDRPGAPITAARDAPPGAVLLYARADGSTAIELRTAAGFAGAGATSSVPLTGLAPGRAGEGYTLVGVFVRGEVAVAPFGATAVAGAAAATSATINTTAAATVATRAEPAAAAMANGAPQASVPPTAVATATAAGATAAPIAPDTSAKAAEQAAAPPPPDGSEIPAGQPAAPGETRAGIGDAATNPDATDRPYIHAIWYDVLALRFAEQGVELLDRSTALRDVVWSTAMEHGPFAAADGSDVFSRVAAELDLPHADDGAIVAAIFAERARVADNGDLAHYPEVLPFDRERVTARLADEAELAARRIVTG